MAGKNQARYKLRKQMNSIKHEPKSRFSEPAVLIKTWEELGKLENDKVRIEVDLEMCSGHLVPKFEVENDEDYYKYNMYLSTHTFYSGQYFYTTNILRELGFNVQLENWDGKTNYCY